MEGNKVSEVPNDSPSGEESTSVERNEVLESECEVEEVGLSAIGCVGV